MASLQNYLALVVVITGLIGTFAGFLWKCFSRIGKTDERLLLIERIQGENSSLLKTFETRFSKLEDLLNSKILEMKEMGTKVGLFWNLVEEKMSLMLMKPTHIEMDVLLKTMSTRELNLEKAIELDMWLDKVEFTGEKTIMREFVKMVLTQKIKDLKINGNGNGN